tara:strand:- start:2574 stop:3047 length:474 start_codon:yes stop_codon:yes gene_type:complete
MAYTPLPPESYQGNQVLINSDRLIFNAKTDSILLFSDKAIGFSTNGSFHFDTSPDENESKFVVNSPNIYLGLEFNNTLPVQPAVLSDDLISSLNEIVDLIAKVYQDIVFNVSYISTAPPSLTGMNPSNYNILQSRMRELQRVKDDFESFKSQNTKLV